MRSPPEARDDAAALQAYGIHATCLPDTAAGFPLWLVEVGRPPHDAALGLLSDTERERAARFRTASLKDRYVAAHAGLRLLAERRFGIAVRDQSWESNDLGKPRLTNVPQAQCSISYTGSCILLAWSEGEEIGVDIEALRPIEDAPELMLEHYTQAECADLRRLDPCGPAFDRAFLTVWVRKEACVKALGQGLEIPLPTVHCGTTMQALPVQVGEAFLDTGVLVTQRDHIVAWARRRGSLLL